MNYVLAVSGGIDSVVLLDMVARDSYFRKLHFDGASWPEDFIVAHFDHGIRPESGEDASFVEQLCTNYGVAFVAGSAKLGVNASESVARERRYTFLRSIAKDGTIVTAHHQDDVLETIVINLLRGTGWRGLAPMTSAIVRPLLDKTKAEIVAYAIDHNLTWHDDETNFSAHYFRNRVRDRLLAIVPTDRHRLMRLYTQQKQLRNEIETEITMIGNNVAMFTGRTVSISRYYLIMIPEDVAVELLHKAVDGRLTRPQLGRLLLFAKVARPGRRLMFGNVRASVSQRELAIEL